MASKEAADYTALVQLAASELRAAVPGATISVDVPWSPYDIDGRSYDWAGLAAAADLLFVMVYDTQSQVVYDNWHALMLPHCMHLWKDHVVGKR